MDRREQHIADLLYEIYRRSASFGLAAEIARRLKVEFAYCGRCDKHVPVDERDTSCVMCGAQVVTKEEE